MGIHHTNVPTNTRPSAPIAATRDAGSKTDALQAALTDMTAAFSNDFVAARIGDRHNTYEHRARVLRQMAGSLATMRAHEAVAL